jgi:hypothetical protein
VSVASFETPYLKPRSLPTQRTWRIGASDSSRSDGDFWLEPELASHESFSGLRAVLSQLRARNLVGDGVEALESYLTEAAPRRDDEKAYGRFLGDAVTFAIMRRVSRESVYTARAIDLAARLLDEGLARAGYARVHVPDVDRLDRPSLKAFARAALLLRPEDRFCWIWHSRSDPLSSGEDGGLLAASRRRLLRQLVAMTRPRFEVEGDIGTLHVENGEGGGRDERAIAEALVVQNYDACFLWCEELLRNGRASNRGEILRLLALAATNVGETQRGLALLADAEAATSEPGRRAHLCYLQGLLEAKRAYDLEESDRHYRRGYAILDGEEAAGELDLERAWLHNGVALNEAVLWRRTQERRHRDEAFRLEQEAFRLVRDGSTPARAYLRFNLVANSAFLVEMEGNFELAIELLSKTFDVTEGGTVSDVALRNGRAALGYRLGMLHYRAGERDQAARLLEEAAGQDLAVESWATRERILRALGAVQFDRGELTAAADAFATGLALCEDGRAAEGAFEHGRGLFAALVAAGRREEAEELRARLHDEEELKLFAEHADATTLEERFLPSTPSPKLPAYIPEIDLEEVPEIDLNRFLGRSLPKRAATLDPWAR